MSQATWLQSAGHLDVGQVEDERAVGIADLAGRLAELDAVIGILARHRETTLDPHATPPNDFLPAPLPDVGDHDHRDTMVEPTPCGLGSCRFCINILQRPLWGTARAGKRRISRVTTRQVVRSGRACANIARYAMKTRGYGRSGSAAAWISRAMTAVVIGAGPAQPCVSLVPGSRQQPRSRVSASAMRPRIARRDPVPRIVRARAPNRSAARTARSSPPRISPWRADLRTLITATAGRRARSASANRWSDGAISRR